MIRKLDDLGRLVIPMEFRRALGVDPKDEMHMELREGVVIVTPVKQAGTCPVCGNKRCA